jgi:hypothetical protein
LKLAILFFYRLCDNFIFMKRWIIKVFHYFIYFVLILSCDRRENVNRPFPLVQTTSVDIIANVGAHFYGKVEFNEGMEIIDYGFLWGRNSIPSFDNDDYLSLGSAHSGAKFDAIAKSDLTKDIKYYCAAYVKTRNLTVYGNVNSFTSLGDEGPKILDFMPKKGTWGDTINVTGLNFSNRPFVNKIFLGEIQAPIVSISDTLLRVVIPDYLFETKSILKVVLANDLAYAADSFQLIVPGKKSFSAPNPSRHYRVNLNRAVDSIYSKLITGTSRLKVLSLTHVITSLIPPVDSLEPLNSIPFKPFELGYNIPDKRDMVPAKVSGISNHCGLRA